jgi:hypothetical protein
MTGSVDARQTDDSREARFVAVLLLGVALVAIGTAFLILGVTISTSPPAPYMSVWDRRFLIGGSALTVCLGVVVANYARRFVGR